MGLSSATGGAPQPSEVLSRQPPATHRQHAPGCRYDEPPLGHPACACQLQHVTAPPHFDAIVKGDKQVHFAWTDAGGLEGEARCAYGNPPWRQQGAEGNCQQHVQRRHGEEPVSAKRPLDFAAPGELGLQGVRRDEDVLRLGRSRSARVAIPLRLSRRRSCRLYEMGEPGPETCRMAACLSPRPTSQWDRTPGP